MNQLLEWSPLIVFFVVFKLYGIYWATAALMGASVALLLVNRLRTGGFKTMHVITAGVALLLGTPTLLLHDKRFIQWKPTILLGLTAIAFLASTVIGSQPLARRMLEGVFSEPLDLQRRTWVRINVAWALWFAALAGANIYIALEFHRERVGQFQGVRNQHRDAPFHDSASHLAQRQDQAARSP